MVMLNCLVGVYDLDVDFEHMFMLHFGVSWSLCCPKFQMSILGCAWYVYVKNMMMLMLLLFLVVYDLEC